MGGGGTITMGGGGNITMGLAAAPLHGTPVPAGATTTNVGAGGSSALIGLYVRGGTITMTAAAATSRWAAAAPSRWVAAEPSRWAAAEISPWAAAASSLWAALAANVTLGGGGTFSLGGGGNITMGGGGATTNEMDYDTANSFVRPPPASTYSNSGSGNQCPGQLDGAGLRCGSNLHDLSQRA